MQHCITMITVQKLVFIHDIIKILFCTFDHFSIGGRDLGLTIKILSWYNNFVAILRFFGPSWLDFGQEEKQKTTGMVNFTA